MSPHAIQRHRGDRPRLLTAFSHCDAHDGIVLSDSATVVRYGVEETFHDYTADLDASGPWQLVGE